MVSQRTSLTIVTVAALLLGAVNLLVRDVYPDNTGVEVSIAHECAGLDELASYRCYRQQHLAQMRKNYDYLRNTEALKLDPERYDKYVVFLTRNENRIREDLKNTFEGYHATPEELGFTEEEFLRVLERLVKRHGSKA